ncbi:hypothetical protein GW813_11160 [bacterium]|nr:hypothetical protein [bacterium]PIV81446.1 MAG: hypothetical protein COW53_04300 [bacterium CG17_big_fil_post_rev_8_21_14_2_50_64_8]PJA76185.1 MAG: hypothetical protein CO151_03545 [bacterium CG_4_9_14_3_um_filter_65_15]
MSVQNLTATACCRLLYYGQAGVGKRENLRLIHQFVPPESRLSIAVEDPERQIGFNLPQPGQSSRQVLVQAVDVGKERYHAAGMTSRLPFDGVVFVINSGVSQLDQSLAAFESLKMFLDSWGMDLMRIPVVLQYNRTGSNEETIPVDRLESLLNPWGLLSFPAATLRGEGVRETLKAVLGLAVKHQEEQAVMMPNFNPRHSEAPPAEPEPPTESKLQLEYGPALPGAEMEESTRLRSEQIFNDLRPPLVIPVKIPRRLVSGLKGPLRVFLEIEFED